MTPDCIHINGIRAYGYTGFIPEEQVLGQWYSIDLTAWVDLSNPGHSDRLGDTYDYTTHIHDIQQLIRTEKFFLIERLADAIAQIVLSSAQVSQVRVQLTKLTPPIPDFDGTVMVDITRQSKAIA